VNNENDRSSGIWNLAGELIEVILEIVGGVFELLSTLLEGLAGL
jgi:hypothetical protein